MRRQTFLYISIGGTIVGVSACIKSYINGNIFDKSIRADGKVAIVTGANSGIGFFTALSLAERGAKVYMACRNLKLCEEKRETIVIKSQNKYVYCRKCDLASFESIRNFVDKFKSEQNRLDILINNAGVMRCPKSVTAEGIETQLGVNHMGHFLLTNLLLDTLKKTDFSRVVVVSSAAHLKGTINKEDLNLDKNYDPAVAYNQSKLANLLFANHLSTLLLHTTVTVNSVHPGLVDTNITRYMNVSKSFAYYIFYPLFWSFIKDMKGGAQTTLYVALEPSLYNVTGRYFSDMKEAEISAEAKDIELASWLWAVSEKWTRLK